MDLTEFLLARIAEDEEDARKAMPGPWTSDGGVYAGHPTNEVVDYAYEGNADHIARWDPARVLAECEAKRRIVEEHKGSWSCSVCLDYMDSDEGPGGDSCETVVMKDWPCPTLRLLSLPYADHPAWREGWRP